MNPVVVTGGTGFVGSAVVGELAARGIPMRCIIRSGTANRLPVTDGVEVVETDDIFACDSAWWAGVLAGTDLAIHLAWYAEPGRYLVDSQNLDCLIGTLEMGKGALAAGLGRFVGVGTCFEYDLRLGYLEPNAPLDPQTPYAAAKAAAFLTLGQLLPRAGVSFLWARLFYLHGAGEDPRRLVPFLHQQMRTGEVADLTSGDQVRDFLDVGEAARMIVDDALSELEGPTNISSGHGVTVRAMAEEIADHYGRRDLLNFGARADNLTDPPCVVGLRPNRGP